MVPVPSRTWRKCSFPLERRPASQPRSVTVRPACAPIPSTVATSGMPRPRIAAAEIAAVNRGFAAALLAPVGLGCTPIFRFGPEEQKGGYLVPAIRGEKLGAFGLSEPNSGSDAASIRTRAERRGDVYVINGTKMFITNGNIADYCLVAAYTDPAKRGSGITMFIIDIRTTAISMTSN